MFETEIEIQRLNTNLNQFYQTINDKDKQLEQLRIKNQSLNSDIENLNLRKQNERWVKNHRRIFNLYFIYFSKNKIKKKICSSSCLIASATKPVTTRATAR